LKSIYDSAYTRFLKKLREAREAAGLSQQELAELLKRHQTYVSKVEKGQRALDLIGFLTWARELQARPEDLLRDLARDVQDRNPPRPRVRLPRTRNRLVE
jgi:transcriptional regulator with XRE-family HTH domain